MARWYSNGVGAGADEEGRAERRRVRFRFGDGWKGRGVLARFCVRQL